MSLPDEIKFGFLPQYDFLVYSLLAVRYDGVGQGVGWFCLVTVLLESQTIERECVAWLELGMEALYRI